MRCGLKLCKNITKSGPIFYSQPGISCNYYNVMVIHRERSAMYTFGYSVCNAIHNTLLHHLSCVKHKMMCKYHEPRPQFTTYSQMIMTSQCILKFVHLWSDMKRKGLRDFRNHKRQFSTQVECSRNPSHNMNWISARKSTWYTSCCL